MTRTLRFTPARLKSKQKSLPELPKGAYSYLTSGDQSIILESTKNTVLVVTSQNVAEKINIINSTFNQEVYKQSLAVPMLVGLNIAVGELLDENNPTNALKQIRPNLYPYLFELFDKNFIFELPRFTGTLEDLSRMRFKEDSLAKLTTTLETALQHLHENMIAHGDIAKRNIFYRGEYPDYEFFLGDFGKITNDIKLTARKMEEDRSSLEQVLNSIRSEVTNRYSNNQQLSREDLNTLYPSMMHSIRRRKGLSPFTVKSVTSQRLTQPTQRKRASRCIINQL